MHYLSNNSFVFNFNKNPSSNPQFISGATGMSHICTCEDNKHSLICTLYVVTDVQ